MTPDPGPPGVADIIPPAPSPNFQTLPDPQPVAPSQSQQADVDAGEVIVENPVDNEPASPSGPDEPTQE